MKKMEKRAKRTRSSTFPVVGCEDVPNPFCSPHKEERGNLVGPKHPTFIFDESKFDPITPFHKRNIPEPFD